MEANIRRSGKWCSFDFESAQRALDEAVNNFLDEDERIVNIETKHEGDEEARFWIYTVRGCQCNR